MGEKIKAFVEYVWENYECMEIIHLMLINRVGWDRYDHFDNTTGNILVELIKRYLVDEGLFTDLGNAYAFSKEQLKGIAELMFSKTPTLLDVELMYNL